MKCKQCITDQTWIRLLPSNLLKNCSNCSTLGIHMTKVLKIGGLFSICIYAFLIALTFFKSLQL